jgi:chromosomal replication initiation ATPase DnaA
VLQLGKDKLIVSIESEIGQNAANTWFKGSSIELDQNNKLIVYLENQFASDWVRHNYSKLIQTATEELLDSKVEILITSKKG